MSILLELRLYISNSEFKKEISEEIEKKLKKQCYQVDIENDIFNIFEDIVKYDKFQCLTRLFQKIIWHSALVKNYAKIEGDTVKVIVEPIPSVDMKISIAFTHKIYPDYGKPLYLDAIHDYKIKNKEATNSVKVVSYSIYYYDVDVHESTSNLELQLSALYSAHEKQTQTHRKIVLNSRNVKKSVCEILAKISYDFYKHNFGDKYRSVCKI